ncbi:MAG: hypothetical protein D6767_04055 [Candidatus Hydrogenedentota bacterium]|nr:MAG: hypothetical protein D6767_04055 [Candidatus Hydrogenedentota bacterium]
MKPLNPVLKLIAIQEKKRFDIRSVIAFAIFVGIFRGVEEGLFVSPNSFRVSFLSAYIPFYFLMYLLHVFVLQKFTKEQVGKVFNVALIGLFLGLFPPVIDLLFFGLDSTRRYGYFLDLFLSAQTGVGRFPLKLLFFYAPEEKLPFGEALTLWMLLFFAPYYVYVKTKSFLRAAFSFPFVYAVIFVNAYILPSAIRALFVVFTPEKNLPFLYAQMDFFISSFQTYLAMIVYFAFRPGLFSHLYKRSVLIFPFLVISLFGIKIAQTGYFVADSIILIINLWLLFQSLLLQNDFYDKLEDKGRKYQPSKDDMTFYVALSSLLILISMAHGKVYAMPMLLILLIGFLYSHPFYRGKRYFPTNLKMEAVWGSMSFVSGTTIVAPTKVIPDVVVIFFLVFGGWSLFAIVKDMKDILTDFYAGNRTVFVLAYQKKKSVKKVYRLLWTFLIIACLVPIVFFLWQHSYLAAILLLLITVILLAISRKKMNTMRYTYFLMTISLYLAVVAWFY